MIKTNKIIQVRIKSGLLVGQLKSSIKASTQTATIAHELGLRQVFHISTESKERRSSPASML